MKRKTVGRSASYGIAQQKKKDVAIYKGQRYLTKKEKKQLVEGFDRCSKCGYEIPYKDIKNCHNCKMLKDDEITDRMLGKKPTPTEVELIKQLKEQARELILETNSLKTEITDSKDKILTFDYDTETSCIEEQRGTIIYWSGTCCHGLQQTGPDVKSLLKFFEWLE